MISARKLTKSYNNSKKILNEVYTDIFPGEITAVFGPSGAGKSTLLRNLSLLEQPDEGKIIIDNHEYIFPLENKNMIKNPWPEITLVFQQLFLWPHLSVINNILLPLEENSKNEYIKDLNDLIDYFEIKNILKSYPNEISLGQKQRVALVRAFAMKPKYLLLDEVTSSLDIEHVSKLLKYMEIMKETGTGIFLISHLIGFIKQSAKHLLFMDNGFIVESGGTEILNSPKTERLKQFLSLIDIVN